MSDITLDRVDAMGDYLTDEVYEIQFVSLPDGFSGIDAEEINLRARTFDIPDRPVNYLKLTHRTFGKAQPTHRTNLVDVTMQMIETMTPKTLPFLRDWMNRCAVHGNNYVFPPSQRQCEILVYHKRNDKTVAYVYNLRHVQIETKGTIGLKEGENPSAIIPQINMNCNRLLEGPDAQHLA